MVRFLFGHGWMVAYYLCFYLMLLIGIVAPGLMFLPLKKASESPDPVSPGSAFIVFWIGLVAFGLVVVNGLVFARVLSASWLLRIVLVLGTATLVTIAFLLVGAYLAQAQKFPAMLAYQSLSALFLAGNLTLLHFAQRPAGSVPLAFNWVLFVIFGILSLPAVIVVALILIGAFLDRT